MQRRPQMEMRRGYEIWVTASGFDSRVICEEGDDEGVLRAEVEERLRKLLAGELGGQLPPTDLGERAHVLWIPLGSTTEVCRGWQSGLPSRPLRSLAEAAVADLRARSDMAIRALWPQSISKPVDFGQEVRQLLSGIDVRWPAEGT